MQNKDILHFYWIEQPTICNGCSKWAGAEAFGQCSVYRPVGVRNLIRLGGCAFNQRIEETKKAFVNPLKASKRAMKK